MESVLQFSWQHGRHGADADRAVPASVPQPVSDPQHAHRQASSWATSPDAAQINNTDVMQLLSPNANLPNLNSMWHFPGAAQINN